MNNNFTTLDFTVYTDDDDFTFDFSWTCTECQEVNHSDPAEACEGCGRTTN